MVLSFLLLLVPCAHGLNNGLDATPPMGYSSWFSKNFGPTERFMEDVCRKLVDSGMAAAGYRYCSVDLGWMDVAHDENGTLRASRRRFPKGMAALGEYVHSLGLLYGLYTSRGTCQCTYKVGGGSGSKGHEVSDVNWIVAQGADLLKVDSCCATQNHSEAFAEYALFRDALNATGRPVSLNLCGWHPWYAPPDPSIGYEGGASLGNSWRINRDGDNMRWIMKNINAFAAVRQYSGPHGWNDPDNVLGPNQFPKSGISDRQARAQFTLWALMPAPLVIGNNILEASQHYFETVLNAELIAINQDLPFIEAAHRVVGGDLVYPCAPTPESPLLCVNVWVRRLSGGAAGIVIYSIGGHNDTRTSVTCDTSCFAVAGITNVTAPHGATLRDVWAPVGEMMPRLTEPFGLTAAVGGDGDARAFYVVPIAVAAAATTSPAATATARSRLANVSVRAFEGGATVAGRSKFLLVPTAFLIFAVVVCTQRRYRRIICHC